MIRKIIHIDMDAFYASIEQRDHPEYRGKPLAVGRAAERGVVAAASYEARKWGVRSAMPSLTAMNKCPELIFVPARFDVYRAVSMRIRAIFFEYSDLVEPLSLDEAYIDVTDNRRGVPSATLIAKDIRRRIWKATGLTASAGVSFNKFLAKVASDYRKPNGMFVVRPEEADAFAEALKVEQFWGVGRVTAEKMHRMGIHTGKDLKRFTEDELIRVFGKSGRSYYLNARGEDDREVTSERMRKSIGAETTFLTDISERRELLGHLREIAEEVWDRLSKNFFTGRTVTLKLKYADFQEMTRRKTLAASIDRFGLFWMVAKELLDSTNIDIERQIRLMGLTVSNTEREQTGYRQLLLDFGDEWSNNSDTRYDRGLAPERLTRD
ncbi:MAG: DNA polymerase IV [Synergistaceae bacterium]|jgi:DNA polymerase-4|nr:DNA polymerase IV [Synergistaceae bacterium]